MLTLTKIAETNSTVTLGWTPPAGVGGYALYANGQVVSVATKNNKDGSPRKTAEFSKAGSPFQVAAVCRTSAGGFSIEVGTYPSTNSIVVYPATALYPSEVSP